MKKPYNLTQDIKVIKTNLIEKYLIPTQLKEVIPNLKLSDLDPANYKSSKKPIENRVRTRLQVKKDLDLSDSDEENEVNFNDFELL